VVFQKG